MQQQRVRHQFGSRPTQQRWTAQGEKPRSKPDPRQFIIAALSLTRADGRRRYSSSGVRQQQPVQVLGSLYTAAEVADVSKLHLV
jgi:hypothetical protein